MTDLPTIPSQGLSSPHNTIESQEGVSFQDVRDHMQETYVLSAQDWENVEGILEYFQNSAGDQIITRAEFFAVYDENGDKCTDPMDSSYFLGKDLPILSGIFHADYECRDRANHEAHYRDFEQSAAQYAKDLENLYYDFSLWKAIGTYLQNEFKIPDSQQIRMVKSCETPDEREELFYLHLRKDLEEALQNWFAPLSQGRIFDRNLIEAPLYYMTEALMGYLRDNPGLDANTLFEVMSFFKKNPHLFSYMRTTSVSVFPDLYPERRNNSFVSGDYTLAATEKFYDKFTLNGRVIIQGFQLDSWGMFPEMIFDIAWYWEDGMQDLFRTIDQNVQAFGSYTITTSRARYIFMPTGNIDVEWFEN